MIREPFKSIMNDDIEGVYQFVSETPFVIWGVSVSGRTPLQLARAKGAYLIGAIIFAHSSHSACENDWSYNEVSTGLLEEFSEESFCAGWYQDIECIFWSILNGEYNFGKNDRLDWLSSNVKACLLEFAIDGGSWPAWRENMIDIQNIPMDEWVEIYQEWKKS